MPNSPENSSEENQLQHLLAGAREARKKAFAPFSHFPVGAALLTSDGQIITGCNIESASYGLTMCAERVAIFKAVSEGHTSFAKIAIVTDTEKLTPPCGACRQVLWELGGDLQVILGNLGTARTIFQLRELLPEPFDSRQLEG